MRNSFTITFVAFAMMLVCMASAFAAKGYPYKSKTGFYNVTFPVPPGEEEYHKAKSSTHLSYAYSKISANFQTPDKSKKVRYRIIMEPIGEYVNANSHVVQKAEAYEQSMLKKKAGVDMVPYVTHYRWGQELNVRFSSKVGVEPIIGRVFIFHFKKYYFMLEALGTKSMVDNLATDLFFETFDPQM